MAGVRRLTRPQHFDLVYGRGSAWTSGVLVLKAMPNGLAFSRCGFSVSRRVGGAVVRNLAKRRLREIMRGTPLRPGWDIVLIARSPAAGTGYAGLKEATVRLLGRARLLEAASIAGQAEDP